MQFQCACGKQYNIPDAVLKKPVTRATCAQCGQRIIIEHPEITALRGQITALTPMPALALAPPVIVAAALPGMAPLVASAPPPVFAAPPPAQTPHTLHHVAHTPSPLVRSTAPALPSFPQPKPVSALQANNPPPPALRTAPPPLPANSPAARQPSSRPVPPARAPEPEPSLTLEPDPPVPDGMVMVEGLSLRSDHGYGVVRIETFLIDVFAVTNADYARYVEVTDALPPHTWNGRTTPAHLAQHPVVGVSRPDAERFAAWRGCRLPTPLE